MSYAPPEENTLGVILGRGKRREADATRRVIGAATPHRSSLGTGFIAIGAAIVCGLRAIYGFAWFAGQVATGEVYAELWPAATAWGVLIAVLVATFVVSRVLGHLPDWMFAIFLVGLTAAVVLDLYSIWPLHDIGRHGTAAITAGMGLVVVLTLRRTGELLIAVSVLGAGLLAAMIINTPWDLSYLAPQLTALAFAVLPAVIGVVVISGFRRLVQVELDRVLVQSTVSAPRFAVGMMASEELARLDLAAEELLDTVATGNVKLPLEPKTASVAASLATELRLHLIEGRRETWLYHAITESDHLGKAVTLHDKSSLAGLLDPQQRDGLLSTAWLLVSDGTKNVSRSVQITVGPATDSLETREGRKITVPIVIESTGVARNRVDPATWEAISRVGQYSDSTQNSSLRVDIECLVDNPADQ
ncbi:MAG: hypothetical protein KF761_01455 [Salinibacterium sp.]|nr:hypothetical protein [Salinibacterium sp.]